MSKQLGVSSKDAGEPLMSSAEAFLDDMSVMVRSTVERHRTDGNIKSAIWAAARELGLPTRRVRAYWHREVRAVWAWEYQQVRQRFRLALENSVERMEAECEAIRAKLRETESDD